MASAVERRRGTEMPTRERILHEASELFAKQGYHATTTRQIADAVGVRQPALFHHFDAKSDIVKALLRWDLDEAVASTDRLAAEDGPAGVRLYRYLAHDLEHLADAPYNLSGVYAEDVMGDPTFGTWARKRAHVHAAVERIVREGVESGDFVHVQPSMVREAIAGILVRTLTLYSGGRRHDAALTDEIASLILRGLLSEPSRMDEIRAAARAVAT
jgi:AcrR family transcriptional regulator